MEEKKDESPHSIHDRGYKLLFSFLKIFQQLIDGYVDKEWKKRLDFQHSQKIDKSFILKEFQQVEADILYKVPLLGEQKEIFLYVLIEFQSTVDHGVAYRVLNYLNDVWFDIYKNADSDARRQKTFKLPPVFGIVLYNGSGKWTACQSVREMVDKGDLFNEFIPNVKYHLIDIPRYDEKKLKKIGDTLAGVFLLEHESESKEDFNKRLKEALAIIAQEPNEELWQSVAQWIAEKLKRKLPGDEAEKLLENLDFEKYSKKEIKTMLETMPEKLITWGKDEERKTIAKNMLAKGCDVVFIAEVTGLSLDEIRKLKA